MALGRSGIAVKFFVPAGAAVVLVMGAVTGYLVTRQQKDAVETARTQARLAEAQIRAARQYLADALEVAAPEAAAAELARSMFQAGEHAVRFIALELLNPDNGAQAAVERAALESFRRGEATELETVEGTGSTATFWRIVADVAPDERCSGCHPGVRRGDVVGAIAVSVPMDRMLQDARDQQLALGLGGMGVVAVLLMVIGVTLRQVVIRPLQERLGAGLLALAEGDLTRQVASAGKDEIGAATEALNRASRSLRALFGTLRESAAEVHAATRKVADAAARVRAGVQQVADTVDQMAQGAQRQSTAATTAADGVRQVGEMVRQVADATQTLAAGAELAAGLAQDGRSALTLISRQMEQIRETVGEAGKAVQDLDRRSQRIGQIVDVITTIAEQTNLLALNAAIEAARAGEHGRGFAVVAEEVRKLAEQSRQAASEIAGLVGEIRQGLDRVVEHTAAGSRAVTEGAGAVGSSGETFEQISRSVDVMVRQIQEISAAARQMATASEQATRAVEEIASVTEQSAAAAEEVASSSQEQAAAVEEVAASARSLAQLADRLMKAIEAFKV